MHGLSSSIQISADMQGHAWNLCSMWYTPRSACEHSVRSAAAVVRIGTHSSSGGGGASARLRVSLRLGADLALPCGRNSVFSTDWVRASP